MLKDKATLTLAKHFIISTFPLPRSWNQGYFNYLINYGLYKVNNKYVNKINKEKWNNHSKMICMS